MKHDLPQQAIFKAITPGVYCAQCRQQAVVESVFPVTLEALIKIQ